MQLLVWHECPIIPPTMGSKWQLTCWSPNLGFIHTFVWNWIDNIQCNSCKLSQINFQLATINMDYILRRSIVGIPLRYLSLKVATWIGVPNILNKYIVRKDAPLKSVLSMEASPPVESRFSCWWWDGRQEHAMSKRSFNSSSNKKSCRCVIARSNVLSRNCSSLKEIKVLTSICIRHTNIANYGLQP